MLYKIILYRLTEGYIDEYLHVCKVKNNYYTNSLESRILIYKLYWF